MAWLGDSSHRGQGCQAWTAVGLPPRYPAMKNINKLYLITEQPILYAYRLLLQSNQIMNSCKRQRNCYLSSITTSGWAASCDSSTEESALPLLNLHAETTPAKVLNTIRHSFNNSCQNVTQQENTHTHRISKNILTTLSGNKMAVIELWKLSD